MKMWGNKTIWPLVLAVSYVFISPIAVFSAGDSEVSPIVILVNSANPVKSIRKNELAGLYMKRKRKWDDGVQVRFLDRGRGSPERKAFTSLVLDKSETDTDLYWIGQKLYAGDSAPQQAESERAMAQFVGSFPGALSYGPASMVLKDPKLKIIKLLPAE